MTNDDIRKNKIDYYVSTLKESYYNLSYLPKILNPYFSKNVPLEKEITTEIRIHERALKNLGYLANFNDVKPSKLNSWDGYWDNTNVKRIRKGDSNAKKLWESIRSVINNPMVVKEVWLFLGNILSKKEFEKQIKKQKPNYKAIQAAYYLQAVMSNVGSIGAKLQIFCVDDY